MDGYKFASVAGMVTMAASAFVEYSLPTLAQVGQPQNQPGQVQPAETPRPAQAQPGQRDEVQRITPQGPGAQQGQAEGIFALREGQAEQKLEQLRQELQQVEMRMQESTQRLMRQLGQVRLLEGDRKVDALSEVVQGMLEEHVEMHNYLTRIRESLAGRGTPGSALGVGEPPADEIQDDFEQKKHVEPEDDGNDIAPATPPQPGGMSPR